MKFIHYLFFILLGVIIYKYIQNIEGLTCFSPFHNTLGNVGSQYNKVNKGSYPVLLKDNLVLKNNGVAIDFTREQIFENDDTLSVVCDPGGRINAPWQLADTSTEKVLRCKNPTNRVIIIGHGGFMTAYELGLYSAYAPPGEVGMYSGRFYYGIYNSQPGQPGFRVFKRMQMITYLNSGDCFSSELYFNNWLVFLHKILTNGDEMDGVLNMMLRSTPSDFYTNLLGKGYSELTTFNQVFEVTIKVDLLNLMEKIKVGNLDTTQPELPLLNQICTENSCSITVPNISLASATFINHNIEHCIRLNVFRKLGPFHNTICIIIINTIEMQNILSQISHPVLSSSYIELFTLTYQTYHMLLPVDDDTSPMPPDSDDNTPAPPPPSAGTNYDWVFTLECSVETISSIRSSIFALLRISFFLFSS